MTHVQLTPEQNIFRQYVNWLKSIFSIFRDFRHLWYFFRGFICFINAHGFFLDKVSCSTSTQFREKFAK